MASPHWFIQLHAHSLHISSISVAESQTERNSKMVGKAKKSTHTKKTKTVSQAKKVVEIDPKVSLLILILHGQLGTIRDC